MQKIVQKTRKIIFVNNSIHLNGLYLFVYLFISQRKRHFSRDEIIACVEEGKRRKVPVMAHAHGAEGIRMAAEAGTIYRWSRHITCIITQDTYRVVLMTCSLLLSLM